ncbi:MAG: SHOCT domain-containing protein [Thermoleophilia bacterium]
MSDPQEQMRAAAREVAHELQRALDQANRLARQAAEDLQRLIGGPKAKGQGASPAEAIRELGKLREEGLITEDEFQSKKTEILSRL